MGKPDMAPEISEIEVLAWWLIISRYGEEKQNE